MNAINDIKNCWTNASYLICELYEGKSGTERFPCYQTHSHQLGIPIDCARAKKRGVCMSSLMFSFFIT